MTRILRVVGMDPSLRNWGISFGTFNLDTNEIKVKTVRVVTPVLPEGKQIRQNSLDLEAAKQLCVSALDAAADAEAIFVEVPIGSQSARAMASYGICVGILGALRATGKPFFEVTPTEVKLASVGIKTATKRQMINWAVQKHPDANWPFHTIKGVQQISEAKAEHMADAAAAIHAGVHTNEFKQLINFF